MAVGRIPTEDRSRRRWPASRSRPSVSFFFLREGRGSRRPTRPPGIIAADVSLRALLLRGTRSTDGPAADPFRRRRRLRRLHGQMEPARRRQLPALAGRRPAGWRWADVGCGNGAFTELRSSAARPGRCWGSIQPERSSRSRARVSPAPRSRFQQGDAMALPWPAASFDAAVMALVIFFVPDPAKSARRDGARGAAGRQRLDLRVAHPRRRLSVRGAAGGGGRPRHGAAVAAERRGVAHGRHAVAVEGRGAARTSRRTRSPASARSPTSTPSGRSRGPGRAWRRRSPR